MPRRDERKLVSIGEIIDVLSHQPVATTRERGWAGITVDLYRPHLNCSERYPALDHHLICYCPYGTGRLTQGREGRRHTGIISKGVSLLMPVGCDSTWIGNAAPSARLRIPTSLIIAAGEQVGRRSVSSVEMRNVFETRDPIIEHMAQIILTEMGREAHPAQALIVEQVSCSLAAHLIRDYNVFDAVNRHEAPALSRAELLRVTEFIEAHLDRQIGLAELAGVVDVSRFHFGRLFKKAMGMTPIRFVEECRLRRAQSLIADTDFPIAEIALMTGFADQSHFTRRFHRHLGCTPAEMARERGRRRSKRTRPTRR